MTKIHVSKYKNLKTGISYIFKTYMVNGDKIRTGLLINVTTKWQENHDEKGKLTKRTLVSDQLIFEPLGVDAYLDFNGEQLKIFSTHIYCGLFEIFTDEDQK